MGNLRKFSYTVRKSPSGNDTAVPGVRRSAGLGIDCRGGATGCSSARMVVRRRERLLLVLVLLVRTSQGIFGLGRSRPRRSSFGLQVASEYLDFGKVPVQENFPWTLPIQNTSPRDVEVLDIKTSCGCASIEPRSLVIPAGKTVSVRFTLDLTTQEPKAAVLHSREFAMQVVPVIKGALAGIVNWQVQGRIWCPLVISPPTLEFAEGSLVKGTPFEFKSVRVVSQQPLKNLMPEYEPTFARAHVVPVVGDACRFQLNLAPAETLGVGEHEFAVMLKGIAQNGTVLPSVPLSVSAHVAHDVQLVPAEIRFHAVTVGDTARETVVLHSRTGKSFRVAEVRAEPENIHVEWLPEPRQARVSLHATRQGPQRGAVQFAVHQERPEGTYYELTCPVLCHVAAGKPTPNPGEKGDRPFDGTMD